MLWTAVVAVLALASSAQAVSSALKVEKLEAEIASSDVIALDTKLFNLYTEAPRNYSIVVVLTATEPGQACDLCQRFAKQYEVVADSWTSLDKHGRLYLSVLEYRNGQEVFAKLKVATAPHILHFPPTEGKHAKHENQRDPNKYETYDMARGAEAEEFVRFLEQIVGHSIPVKKPTNYSGFFLSILIVLATAAVARLAWLRFSEYLKQPTLWAVIAMVFTLFFISGHAWNSIRGAPFVGREAISPQFQQQFGAETRMVATLYGAAAFAFIMQALHVPGITTPSTQRLFAYGYAILFVVASSALIAVFRMKYGHYPYRLLF